MFQLTVSQTVFHHFQSGEINPFNIRVFDKPTALEGEMWQVMWWRENAFGDPAVHTEWNTLRFEYPDRPFGDFEEEVCVPGWNYWWEWSEIKAKLPLKNSMPPISWR